MKIQVINNSKVTPDKFIECNTTDTIIFSLDAKVQATSVKEVYDILKAIRTRNNMFRSVTPSKDNLPA